MEEKRKDKRIPINAIVMYRIEDYEKIDDQNLAKIDRHIIKNDNTHLRVFK